MKNNYVLQLCNLAIFVAVTTASAVNTSAQTFVRPVIHVAGDTVRQASKTPAFDMQVQADQNPSKFILSVNNPFGEKLKISVTPAVGSGFNDHTSALTYCKRINLSNAEEGVYTITVSSEKRTLTRSLTLTGSDYSKSVVIE